MDIIRDFLSDCIRVNEETRVSANRKTAEYNEQPFRYWGEFPPRSYVTRENRKNSRYHKHTKVLYYATY